MKLYDIIIKDMRVTLRDRVALIFIFLMPIVLMTILGFALGGMFNSGSGIGGVTIAVVDETALEESESVAQQLRGYGAEGAEALSFYAVLDSPEVAAFLDYKVMDAATAQAHMDAGELDAIVTIPKGALSGIAEALTGKGTQVQLDVLGAPDRAFKTEIVKGLVTAYADALSYLSADIHVLVETLEEADALQMMPQLNIASFMENLAGAQTTDIVMQGAKACGAVNSFSYYAIGITCMFVLYSAGRGSSFLHTESTERTLMRLQAAGVPNRQLLLGKSFAVFFLCVVQLLVLLGISTLMFGIDWGNTATFMAIAVCMALAVTGLGVMLMVLVYRFNNPNIGVIFQSVIIQVLGLLGGSYLPLSVLPPVFSSIALATPNGLAVQAFTGNVTGAPLWEILPYMAGCVGFGIVFYLLGLALFPKERRV